jgi:hypothetical protein
MKRALALALVSALVAAGVAHAVVKAGRYAGETERGTALSFEVVNTRKHVIRFHVDPMRLRCSDGGRLRVSGFTTSRKRRFAIEAKGRFTFTLDRGRAGTAEVEGFLQSGRADGLLQQEFIVDEDHEFDPGGRIECVSGLVDWDARRR